MRGHGVTLSRTNAGAWIAVCGCGWLGGCHFDLGDVDVEHVAHVRQVRADHAAQVAQLKATLGRPGRFSHA